MSARSRNVAAAVWVALFVATACMWVRSTMRGDEMLFRVGDRLIRLRSVGGMIVGNCNYFPYSPLLTAWDDKPLLSSRPRSVFNTHFANGNPWTRLGFWWLRYEGDISGWQGAITWASVPYWFATLITGVIAGRLAVRAWKQRVAIWRREGRCANCGYDLRATPLGCPECGTMHEANRPSAAVVGPTGGSIRR